MSRKYSDSVIPVWQEILVKLVFGEEIQVKLVFGPEILFKLVFKGEIQVKRIFGRGKMLKDTD